MLELTQLTSFTCLPLIALLVAYRGYDFEFSTKNPLLKFLLRVIAAVSLLLFSLYIITEIIAILSIFGLSLSLEKLILFTQNDYWRHISFAIDQILLAIAIAIAIANLRFLRHPTKPALQQAAINLSVSMLLVWVQFLVTLDPQAMYSPLGLLAIGGVSVMLRTVSVATKLNQEIIEENQLSGIQIRKIGWVGAFAICTPFLSPMITKAVILIAVIIFLLSFGARQFKSDALLMRRVLSDDTKHRFLVIFLISSAILMLVWQAGFYPLRSGHDVYRDTVIVETLISLDIFFILAALTIKNISYITIAFVCLFLLFTRYGLIVVFPDIYFSDTGTRNGYEVIAEIFGSRVTPAVLLICLNIIIAASLLSSERIETALSYLRDKNRLKSIYNIIKFSYLRLLFTDVIFFIIYFGVVFHGSAFVGSYIFTIFGLADRIDLFFIAITIVTGFNLLFYYIWRFNVKPKEQDLGIQRAIAEVNRMGASACITSDDIRHYHKLLLNAGSSIGKRRNILDKLLQFLIAVSVAFLCFEFFRSWNRIA